ncbi:hypothetical protein NA57DRAFT_53793 [Rhizodiscina lignyota]|uniref:Uncharacterized protein n=1 Tax=Rhizodiscina lignyota TaxID=1504668 RepID=A0A9P4IIQ3_9PEZI|nr:hypothetical protein NA57DRAFT_53793 [Rhizodiscina lignyota]
MPIAFSRCLNGGPAGLVAFCVASKFAQGSCGPFQTSANARSSEIRGLKSKLSHTRREKSRSVELLARQKVSRVKGSGADGTLAGKGVQILSRETRDAAAIEIEG